MTVREDMQAGDSGLAAWARAISAEHNDDHATIATGRLSPTELSATFAALDDVTLSGRVVAALGSDFRRQVVDAPTGEMDYARAPGTVSTLGGALIVAYRIGSRHDLTGGGLPGTVVARRSRDAGLTFEAAQTVVDFTAAGSDVGDVALYRAPNQRRIYLATWEAILGTTRGLYLCHSDDDGGSWSAPVEVYDAEAAFGAGPRLVGDQWKWPIYRKVGGYWRATLLTASTPYGAWTTADVYAPASADATEWDFIDHAPDNWIAVIRRNGATAAVSQSTNQGATWSALIALPTNSAVTVYDGWPALRPGLDGRVLLFIRGVGKGIRVLSLMNPDAPLTASNWTEGGSQGGARLTLDNGGAGSYAGSFHPVRFGRVWVGAYQVETDGSEVSEIRLGRFDERALRSGWSWVPGAEKIADGSAAGTWTTLTTPDRVTIRTVGGLYKIRYNVRSYQTGTVSNFQAGVSIDGAAPSQTDPSFLTVGGSARNTAAGYYDTRETVVYLPPGVHTITLQFKQDVTTVGRTFDQRFLVVEPFE